MDVFLAPTETRGLVYEIAAGIGRYHVGGCSILCSTVRDYIDIIEIGTPFVIEYGMEAVRVMKKEFQKRKF